MPSLNYPWYACVTGDALEQGDIINACPVFSVPSDLDVDLFNDAAAPPPVGFDYQEFDVIVMSQSCDLVRGREKVSEVMLCPVDELSDFADGPFMTPKGKEQARRGYYPAYHMLNECTLSGHEADVRLVEFRRVFSLPLPFLRNLATRRGERVRLLPPYREHLSQAFARFFMRVGLPVDIPPFA